MSTDTASPDTIESDAHAEDIHAVQSHMNDDDGKSLFERLGGIYGIAGAVDVLTDRLYDNASANSNPAVAEFHAQEGHAGFKFLVTAWSIEQTGGPKCYPGQDMTAAHDALGASQADFDTVALEIAATLSYVGVPKREHDEFMAIIESYRPEVVDGEHVDG